MSNAILRYAIATSPQTEARARYALELLFDGIGLPCVCTTGIQAADVIYAYKRPEDAAATAVWIPAARIDNWDQPEAACCLVESLPLLHCEPSTQDSGARASGDIVYSTYVVVSGALEQHDERDAWGGVLGAKSSLKRLNLLERPLVADYCRHLQRLLQCAGLQHRGVARWPVGKRFAIAISHDVDFPFSRPTAKFQAKRFARDFQRGEWKSAQNKMLSLFKTMALQGMRLAGEAKSDPNFCFERWRQLLSKLNARSCFYVAAVSSADRGSCKDDVDYDYRDRAMVGAMRECIDEGFEIGLHASINAKQDPQRMASERELLESVLDGYRLRGVRHHYWSMDSQFPERTLRSHAEAGFCYDSSFGLNDAPGFRRGICWPFTPFDRERVEAVPILEVPPTLMDGAIFSNPVAHEEGCDRIRRHIQSIADQGGAVVLDWHLEQLNPSRLHGAGPALQEVLLEFAGESEIYWASPAEISDWWQLRRRQIAEHAET